MKARIDGLGDQRLTIIGRNDDGDVHHCELPLNRLEQKAIFHFYTAMSLSRHRYVLYAYPPLKIYLHTNNRSASVAADPLAGAIETIA
jgi:hypothetical protein